MWIFGSVAVAPMLGLGFGYDGPGFKQKCIFVLGSKNRPVLPSKPMFQRFLNILCCLKNYYDIKTFFFCTCVVIPNYK